MVLHNAIQRAVRSALPAKSVELALGCALLLAATTTWAAEPPASQSAAAEGEVTEVVVVGSRIRRDTFNSPSPVQVITREEATAAGFASTTEALQSNAVTTGGAQINNAFGGFVTDGGPGANTIGLRGLGAGRTLVLINGRRVAPAGTRGAVGSADLNVLPNAMVERVEVLRDGASSVYGSDAVAGVVNVITRNKVDDLTFEGQYNMPFEDGGEQARFAIVGGTVSDRWNVSGSLEYYERENLTLGDRDWTKCNTDKLTNRTTGQSLDFVDPTTGRPKCYPITGTGSNGVTINTIGTSTVAAVPGAGAVTTTFNRLRPNAAVTTGVAGYEGVGGGTNNLNVRDTFEPDMLNRNIISPVEVYTGFLQGGFNLQALGNGELYFELLANRRESEQTNYRQLSMDYRRLSPAIPANLQFSTFGPDQGTSGGQAVGVRAFVGFGNDQSEQEVDYYKPTIGLRGDLFIDRWRYDTYASYAKSDATYRQQSFLTDKVTYASDVVVAPAGFNQALVLNGNTCRINLTNQSEACVPFPLLTADVVGGNLPQNFRDYIFRTVEGSTEYEEAVFAATIDGPLIDLPAGPLQAVFGAEYRKQEIDDTPDENSITGNLYNLTSSTPTRGTDNVAELYTEVEVPIVADQPYANEITFNGSFRFTDYESYGSGNTYKLGLVYSPVDWVSFRVTEGTSFRAPALYEQYQGATSGFLSQAGDPCNNYGTIQATNPTRYANCAAEIPGNPAFMATSSIRVFSEGGAAAGLEAETSDNLTFGVILEPQIGDSSSLSIAIDYFDIKIENGVDQVGAANLLALCYDDPDFRAGGGYCNLSSRNAATNAMTVSNAYTNIATQVVKGIDYTARYTFEAGPGSVRVNANVTQYKSQAQNLFPDDPRDEYNGSVNWPEWAGVLDVSYTWGNWRVLYGLDWIDSMKSYTLLGLNRETTPYDFEVGQYFEHRASLRYRGDSWEATFGVRNLMDEEPPTISQGYYNRVGNAPLYSGYDYVGREGFLTISKSF